MDYQNQKKKKMNSKNLKRQLDDFLETESNEILNNKRPACKISKADDAYTDLSVCENSFSNLPHEILLHIFKMLNMKEICRIAR